MGLGCGVRVWGYRVCGVRVWGVGSVWGRVRHALGGDEQHAAEADPVVIGSG